MHITILLTLSGDSIALFDEQMRGKCHILKCFRKSLGASV